MVSPLTSSLSRRSKDVGAYDFLRAFLDQSGSNLSDTCAVMSILAVFPVCRAVRVRIIVDQRRTYQQRLLQMVTITFADRETEKRCSRS